MPARHVEIQVLCDRYGARADARRARVLDPAPPPEARSKSRRAPRSRRSCARQMEAAAERACRAVGYRNAGTFEFLLGPGLELLLHRAERAAPGRASGHRALHGDRPRARAAARRRRRAALRHRPRAAPRPCDRDPRQRRGPGARLPAGAGPHRALRAAAGAGRAHRHVRRVGRDDLAVLRLDGREGDRLGLRPPGGDRARRARARRARGRRRADDTRRRTAGARAASRSEAATTRRRRSRRSERPNDRLAAPGAPAGALPALPVGSLRPGDRLAVRGRDRPVGARDRGVGRRATHRSSTRASPRPRRAGRPTGSAPSSAARSASPSTSSRRSEVPAEVAINEAVAFTKRYASEDGARLVNGILGRIQREAA